MGGPISFLVMVLTERETPNSTSTPPSGFSFRILAGTKPSFSSVIHVHFSDVLAITANCARRFFSSMTFLARLAICAREREGGRGREGARRGR